jgi:hypothetical protein
MPAGVSWIWVLASFNVSAQVALPGWGRGRVGTAGLAPCQNRDISAAFAHPARPVMINPSASR